MSTATSPLPDDRVIDWLYELLRLTNAADTLAPTARSAVVAVIDAFAAEDGYLPQTAAQARTTLAATAAVEPNPTTAEPSIVELLTNALTARLHRGPLEQPAQTAAGTFTCASSKAAEHNANRWCGATSTWKCSPGLGRS